MNLKLKEVYLQNSEEQVNMQIKINHN